MIGVIVVKGASVGTVRGGVNGDGFPAAQVPEGTVPNDTPSDNYRCIF